MAVAKPKPVVLVAVDPRSRKAEPVEPPMQRIVLIAVAVAMSAIGLVYALSQLS
jgi:hypothetical protein